MERAKGARHAAPAARSNTTRERAARARPARPGAAIDPTLNTVRPKSRRIDDAEAANPPVVDQNAASLPIRITHENTVVGSIAEALWEVYSATFQPLTTLAVLQHYYTREEILAELANPRITKIIGWQGAAPVGLAMVTNSLDEVPQISPDFLRARYPEHAARNTIFFGILVMVSKEVRGRTLFARLYTELWQVPALHSGVLVFDICEFNRTMFNTDALTQRIAESFPHSSVSVLDRQTWYVAELPEAIADAPLP